MRTINIAFRPVPALSRCVLCLLICSGGWIPDIAAARLTYSLGFRSEHSDNIFRLPDDQEAQSEVINTINAGFSYLENTSRFNARVAGSTEYNDYRQDRFADESNSTLDAYGEFFPVPEVFGWVAADGFRKVRVDSLLPDVPTNRRDSNIFVTGPNVYLRIGPVDTVAIEGRVGRATTENLNIDSDRKSYAARWAHRMSARSTLSLGHEYQGVDYDNSLLNDDFRRQNLFLRLNLHSARIDSTLDLGQSKIDMESADATSNSLVRLALAWQTTSISSLNLAYARGYSDTGAELLPAEASAQPSVAVGAPPVSADIVTGEPFYSERTDLYYTRSGSSFPWTVRLFTRDIDFEISPNDSQEKGSLVNVNYIYSGSLSFSLSSSYTVLATDLPVSEIRNVNSGLALIYRARPRLTTSLDFRRFERKSSDFSQKSTDDRVAFTITYRN